MKFLPIAFAVAILSIVSTKAADNSRSDSIDIIHQHLDLRITDLTTHVISGFCTTHFKAKVNGVTNLVLDLQGFTVDSVIQNNTSLAFTNSAMSIDIQLQNTLNANDTSTVTVYYQGVPATDPQWGGFYWSGTTYAYNLGVAFQSIPHNFGRAWFPCFDNFVERSTYSFAFTTPADKMAVSNGLLTDSVTNFDGTKTWHWEISQTIPSYLVCVQIAAYTPVWQQYTSIYGPTIPVMMAALEGDTTEMKGSFVNLDNALQVFEQKWGPYAWDKVGYAAVPFSSGAMEHATCISYPVVTLNGNTAYETLMAHELSHHWFGDLVTCETAEDMWLNEGWAVFCEHIFTEALYGEQAYFDAVQANHETAIHYAHIDDGGYHPLSGMPQNVTYGSTTYKRGADVAHTIRAYMGDTLFFNCVKDYLSTKSFQHASSADFRDHLSSCSGIDLTNFFNDWVFQEGSAAFWVDSFAITSGPTPEYDVQVFVRQKLNHAPQRYTNVPLELTFMSATFDTVVRKVWMSGACNSFSVSIPFEPVYVGCDILEKISDAVVGQNKFIDSTGNNNFVYGKMNLTVANAGGNTFMRIEHRYAPPDPIIPSIPNLHISDYRHWKVEGVWGNGFDASAQIQYNGSNSTSGGYLDNNLMTNSEDSVVLLYRKGVHHAWAIETDIVKTIAAPSDKKGFIKINHLKQGEYALAIFDYDHVDVPVDVTPDSCAVINSIDVLSPISGFNVFPNPTDGLVHVNGKTETTLTINIFDATGKLMWNKKNVNGSFNLAVDTTRWAKGIYFVSAIGAKVSTKSIRFAVSP